MRGRRVTYSGDIEGAETRVVDVVVIRPISLYLTISIYCLFIPLLHFRGKMCTFYSTTLRPVSFHSKILYI